MPPSPRHLVACLIVRDESAHLTACLASLRGQVADVLVYDTGSVDGTPELAASLGATVVRGSWPDDFAAARNAALAEAVTRFSPAWVLSIDADECLTGRLTGQAWLDDPTVDAASLAVRNDRPEDAWTHRAVRCFRPDRVVWRGRVHEHVVPRGAGPLRVVPADAAAVGLSHAGYADRAAEQAKALRNAALAQAELAQPGAPADRRARLLLDLGRSLVSADRPQEALDALVAARDAARHGDPVWQAATDFLARVLLSAGEYPLATDVSADLRATGHASYCDWLDAQALVHLGDPHRALALLDGLDDIVDTEGRRFDRGVLHEARALAATLCGAHDRAADELVVAMGRYGRVDGRHELARELWERAGRPADELDPALRAVGYDGA